MVSVNLAFGGSFCSEICLGAHLVKQENKRKKAHVNGFPNNRVVCIFKKQKQEKCPSALWKDCRKNHWSCVQ